MKKLKLYLDTSVLNFALSHNPSLEVHKKATVDLLGQIQDGTYEGFISDQVIAEINRAPTQIAESLTELVNKLDVESLSLSDEAEKLADKYVAEGIIPVKYRDDALHIAIASVNDMDVIISWNFQHMVKLKTKHGVIAVNGLMGYKSIEIVSPEEVI